MTLQLSECIPVLWDHRLRNCLQVVHLASILPCCGSEFCGDLVAICVLAEAVSLKGTWHSILCMVLACIIDDGLQLECSIAVM